MQLFSVKGSLFYWSLWNIFGFTENGSLHFGFPDQIQNQKSNYIKSGGLPTNNLVNDITKEICHVMTLRTLLIQIAFYAIVYAFEYM